MGRTLIANTTMDRPDGDQLALPLVSDPGSSPVPGARSARRSRRRDRQLWLFAPYRQVDLPMTPDAPQSGAGGEAESAED